MNRPGLVSLLAAIASHAILLVALPVGSPRPSAVQVLPKPKYLEVTLAESAPAVEPSIPNKSEVAAPSPVFPPVASVPVKEAERPVELARTIEPSPPPQASELIREVDSPAAPKIKTADSSQVSNSEESVPPSNSSSFQKAASGDNYEPIQEPYYLSRAKTEYPAQARRLRQEGVVWLDLYINVKGDLDKIEVRQSSGFPLLDRAALAAERKSRFRPAVINGQTVPSKVEVPYRFKLKP